MILFTCMFCRDVSVRLSYSCVVSKQLISSSVC